MKSFCKAGRLASVLKLELPQIKEPTGEESQTALRFNGFYSSLAGAYQELASKIAEEICDGNNPPARVSVSFNNMTDEYKEKNIKSHKSIKKPLVIKRHVRINRAGNITTGDYVDVFDCDGGIFIK